MTTKEWIDKQKKLLKDLVEKNKPLEVAAKSVMALQATRIFKEGKKSDGSQIGKYDTTTPFYINPDYSPRASANKAKGIKGLKRTGKDGESKFKNGKAHKTSYQKSYSDFRKNIGRQNTKVDLTLSGDLQSDFRNAQVGSVSVKPKRISASEYQVVIKREINQKKMEGMEDKYGKITPMTKFERSEFIRIAGFELRKHFAQ